MEKVRARRLRAVLARAERWRWRDQVTGLPFGKLFRRSIQEDPGWARLAIHRHRVHIERREVDGIVGAAMGRASSSRTSGA
jgi:hypothetical protein